ncbi:MULTISPECIES: phosphoenolpyruvate mutase [Streptomyces]|nr:MULTISPECIES: phosphoenolpyruvate mutase [Streptomyces]MYT03291.1 phosphoenolpyruvate mutase [Streptomyces sp. SID5470]
MSTGTRSARLRALFEAPELFFFMEAHDGLSARIADTAGFPALWASGLSISTALGVRDSSEASWSQILDVVARVVDASHVPVMVDGDTGHGDFNSARRFTRQAERIGASAVCLEDKVFPKMNSFVGDGHELAPVGEFCGKLRACLDARDDDDFRVVARTEALIAGGSVAEALERAHAYADAGAHAVFIHSRRKTAEQIAEFAAAWRERLPLVIAPTTYADTPTAEFRAMGIKGVIWANQNMRAAFAAMSRVSRDILAAEGVVRVEDDLAPLSEVFDLLGYDELAEDERKYADVELGLR